MSWSGRADNFEDDNVWASPSQYRTMRDITSSDRGYLVREEITEEEERTFANGVETDHKTTRRVDYYDSELAPPVPEPIPRRPPPAPQAPPQAPPGKRKKRSKNCWPFIIYLIVSAVIIIGFVFSARSMNETITYVLLQIVWIIIVGFIIYWLCRSGHVGWAWIVLFLPLLIQLAWVLLSIFLPN